MHDQANKMICIHLVCRSASFFPVIQIDAPFFRLVPKTPRILSNDVTADLNIFAVILSIFHIICQNTCNCSYLYAYQMSLCTIAQCSFYNERKHEIASLLQATIPMQSELLLHVRVRKGGLSELALSLSFLVILHFLLLFYLLIEFHIFTTDSEYGFFSLTREECSHFFVYCRNTELALSYYTAHTQKKPSVLTQTF